MCSGVREGISSFHSMACFFTSYIVFDRGGMNLETGVFFSDEDLTNSICDMMPSSEGRVPCESGC